MTDRQVNDKGEVAVRYYMTVPQFLTVNGHEYVFNVNANICMSWVHPDEVDRILSTSKVCCGGQVRQDIYRLADETQVRRWLGISDR